MVYIPHTEEQWKAMLQRLGLERVEQLFQEQIPEAQLLDRPLRIPPPMFEIELRRHFQELAERSLPAGARARFVDAGTYDH